MAHVEIAEWWKAKEIPLIEADWRNIRLYCEQHENPFDWERCLYIIRFAPPYALTYGDESQLISPLLYVGSGFIRQRWATHRGWLYQLGHAIPGGRYEVWVQRPRSQHNEEFYKDIEADILSHFRAATGCLPFRNLRVEGTPRRHTYESGFFDEIIGHDRRYIWAMYPISGPAREWYCR
jgi:hypothetical protein